MKCFKNPFINPVPTDTLVLEILLQKFVGRHMSVFGIEISF